MGMSTVGAKPCISRGWCETHTWKNQTTHITIRRITHNHCTDFSFSTITIHVCLLAGMNVFLVATGNNGNKNCWFLYHFLKKVEIKGDMLHIKSIWCPADKITKMLTNKSHLFLNLVVVVVVCDKEIIGSTGWSRGSAYCRGTWFLVSHNHNICSWSAHQVKPRDKGSQDNHADQ